MSKIHNCTARKFDGFAGRGEIADRKNTPGPGNYKLPSEFGYYISKKASRNLMPVKVPEPSKHEDKENIE